MFKAPNDIHRNWNKDMYIASKLNVEYDDYNNEIVTYDTPFYFGKANYQPLTSKNLEAYMQVYGETDKNILGLLISNLDADKIKLFDLAYLNGATPDGEEVNGQNANYVVKAYKPQNTKVMILFEELVKER